MRVYLLPVVLSLCLLSGGMAIAQDDPYDPGPAWTRAGDQRFSGLRDVSLDRRGTVWTNDGARDLDTLNLAENASQGYAEVAPGAFGFESAVFFPAEVGAAPDTVVIASPTRRSVDGGQSWTPPGAFVGGDVMIAPLPGQAAHGRILVGKAGGNGGLWISDDRGVTWDSVTAHAPCPAPNSAYGVDALAAFPAAGAPDGGGPGTGRLLRGGYTSGVSYSNNGGDTWTASSLWSLTTHVKHLAVLARPEGGLRAVAFGLIHNAGCGCARVWTSDDGGATWVERAQLSEPVGNGLAANDPAALVAVGAPPGDVTYGTSRAVAVLGRGRLFATSDAGLTWELLPGGLGQAPLEDPDKDLVNLAAMTWDGQLLLGVSRIGAATAWSLLSAERLADVIAVWEEGAPAPSGELGLRIEPNPTDGRATLHLTLAKAGPVTVEVYDALGRRVSRAELSGTPGVHAIDLGAERLAPGLYVVRVTALDGGQVVTDTRAVTVAR